MKTTATHPENGQDTGRSGRAAGRLLAAALTATVLALAPGGAAAARTDAREICPASDQGACLVRCKLHKRACHGACVARKKQCLHKVRAEVQACKLGCRADESLDENSGACKRSCVAVGVETARKQCKAGKPVCMRKCNPETCRELCAVDDEPGDDTTNVEPAGQRPTDAGELGDVVAATCVPPTDRECLGECAAALRQCVEAVHQAGRQCLEGCRELRGEERWICYRECAASAHAQGRECSRSLRRCAADCRNVVADTE